MHTLAGNSVCSLVYFLLKYSREKKRFMAAAIGSWWTYLMFFHLTFGALTLIAIYCFITIVSAVKHPQIFQTHFFLVLRGRQWSLYSSWYLVCNPVLCAMSRIQILVLNMKQTFTLKTLGTSWFYLSQQCGGFTRGKLLGADSDYIYYIHYFTLLLVFGDLPSCC